MSKRIEFGAEARQKLVKGIDTLADAVVSTLGPNGRNVVYIENGTVVSTKDGVSVAKNISELEDPIENLGAQMVKQAAIKTADHAGDGTNTLTVQTTDTDANAACGAGVRFSTATGEFFTRGHFVFATQQSIILSKYNPVYNGVVGFKVTEDVVTVADDVNLYDNQGTSPNTTAPGADRYRITLTLTDLNNI